MRRRKAQLLGLGHPLVDALIAHLQSASFRGDVALLSGPVQQDAFLSIRTVVYVAFEDERRERIYKHYLVAADGSWREAPSRFDLDCLAESMRLAPACTAQSRWDAASSETLDRLGTYIEAEIRANTPGLSSIRRVVAGYALSFARL